MYVSLRCCKCIIIISIWLLFYFSDNHLKFVWVGGETYQNSIIIPYSHSIVHEGYREVEGVPIDDIALIKLFTPLQFSSKVRPTKFPLGGSGSTRLLLVARGKDEVRSCYNFVILRIVVILFSLSKVKFSISHD